MPAHFIARKMPANLAAIIAAYSGPITVCKARAHTPAENIVKRGVPTAQSEIARCITAIN
jgi:hypothetical protein